MRCQIFLIFSFATSSLIVNGLPVINYGNNDSNETQNYENVDDENMLENVTHVPEMEENFVGAQNIFEGFNEDLAGETIPTANVIEQVDDLEVPILIPVEDDNAGNQPNAIEQVNDPVNVDQTAAVVDQAADTTELPTEPQLEYQAAVYLPVNEAIPIDVIQPAEDAVKISETNPIAIDSQLEHQAAENLPVNEEIPQEVQQETTEKIAVRFDSKGESIDDDKHHEQNCQVKEDSQELKPAKKRKLKNQNSPENSPESDPETSTTPRVAVRFDSKGDSIDEDNAHHDENCEVGKSLNEGKPSRKKTKNLTDSNDHDEDQIDSENEASDERHASCNESDEDDGIPVITIPLGDILRKYARMMEGDNSEYEEESDERFVIKGYNDKKKGKQSMEL